jgi:hypothetical protein
MRVRPTPSSFFAFLFISGAIFSTMACHGRPQGYWTRPDRSQAVTNQEFPADEQGCQALVARDSVEPSQTHKAKFFAQCMQAKGYQWVAEPRSPHPLHADAQRSLLSPEQCAKGRLTVDAFGYQKCVPRGTKDGGIFEVTAPPPPRPSAITVPSGPSADAPTMEQPSHPVDGRAKDDEACRQYAKESMSGTYGVYTQCMKDKGWSPKP